MTAILKYVGWNVMRRLMDCDFAVEFFEDKVIIISNNENYATLLYCNKLWDFSDMYFLLHLLRPEDVFYDIGANVGCYSVLVAGGTGAQVTAFEPVPETFRKLSANVRLNALEDLVRCLNKGVGNTNDMMRFTTALGGLNYIDQSGRVQNGIEVEVVTLDSYPADRKPCAIKMDVAGYEANVMIGAKEIFASHDLRVLIVELNGSGKRYGFEDEDLHRMIMDYGFVPVSYKPQTREVTPCASFNAQELNTIYCRLGDDIYERLSSSVKFKAGNMCF